MFCYSGAMLEFVKVAGSLGKVMSIEKRGKFVHVVLEARKGVRTEFDFTYEDVTELLSQEAEKYVKILATRVSSLEFIELLEDAGITHELEGLAQLTEDPIPVS